ncbi:MAG: thioredoxin [Armatimonadota bacterium]
MSKAVEVTESSFEQEVLQSSVPVLVDFWAPWCGPCRMLAPTVDQIADEFAGRLRVVKVNTDDNPGVAARYQIMSIPTLMLFKEGKPVDQMVGVQPKSALVSRIERHIA